MDDLLGGHPIPRRMGRGESSGPSPEPVWEEMGGTGEHLDRLIDGMFEDCGYESNDLTSARADLYSRGAQF